MKDKRFLNISIVSMTVFIITANTWFLIPEKYISSDLQLVITLLAVAVTVIAQYFYFKEKKMENHYKKYMTIGIFGILLLIGGLYLAGI